MITFKFIPNILSKEGREIKELKYSRNKTLLEYLTECNYPTEDIKIIVSGKVVKDLKTKLRNNDEVIIISEVKIPAVMLTAKFWVAAWAVVKTVFTVAMIGYTIYSMLSKPRKQSFSGFGTGIDDGSPTYGWDGIRTIQDVGVPVAVIYGEHLFGGNVINSYVRTDGDKNYLNVLLGVCEGEIESISDLKINGNPSDNFDGITTSTRMGTNSQTVIPNFEDAHNLYPVNVTLTQSNPHVYTTTDSDVEGFEIYLQCPNGLFQQDSGSGAIQEWTVTYKVEYKLHTASTYTDLGTTDITAKSRTTVRRIYRKVGLTAGQYDIRVTRTSDDSSLSPLKEGDLVWTQLDEIKTDDFAYPNTALLGIEALATDQLSGSMPNFTFKVKGKKVSAPKVMNGATQVDWEDYYWDDSASTFKLLSDDTVLSWDGTTYEEQYCANPIWCVKDLLLNSRYGLGEFIDSNSIDDSVFLEMAKYCEEKVPNGRGGYEKRFELNVVLDSSTQALDVISQLCSSFRGLPFYSEGAINIKIDKEDSPVQLFNMGNIIKDSFVQSWKSQKDIPNVLEIQYLDKDEDYKQETIAYIDEDSLGDGDPMRKKTIRMFATNISQVLREARYNMKVAKYINRSISFKAGIDAVACQAGDLISVQHDVPQWGYGGRVKSGSTTTKVVVDQTLTIEDGKNYSIQIQFADDTIEERAVNNAVGDTTEITVSSAFSQTPAEYDKYVFGETNSVKKDFRVTKISREGEAEVTIEATEYDSAVYDDSDVTLPDNNFSSLSLEPPVVSNLSLTESLVKLKDGTIENSIDVWWDKPDQSNYVKTYERGRIYISEDNSNWRKIGETTGYHYKIIGDIVDRNTYYVKVVTVTAAGQEGSLTSAPRDSITIVGKSANPSDVSSFIVRQSRDRLTFGWTEISDVDVWGYEIRLGADWASGEFVVFQQGNKYITTNFRTGASQKYWIKAIDTSGNYSDNATEAIITIDSIPFRNIVNDYAEGTGWTGTKDDTEKDGNNLIIDKLLDYMEYANDTDAQTAYVASDSTNFQCYSESSIKTQGDYSLKCSATITDSLNETLTRTISSPIDLSGKDTIKFSVRASRTGSNFKIAIHDSGGTTTEHTVNITTADTWQTETWDISSIVDADKDAIDQIKITITNADAANTIYIDNIHCGGLTTGTYETPVRDIGYVATFQIQVEITTSITEGAAFNSSPTARFNDDSTTRFTGSEAPGSWHLEINTSEDNTTWSGYETWEAGDYKCRYFKLRLTLTRETEGTNLLCSKFDYFADLPDVDEFGSDSVTVAADGKAVTFSKTYHEEPSVHIEITSGNGIYSKFTAKDTTGFTVKLYDASGTAQTGDFDFHVHGL